MLEKYIEAKFVKVCEKRGFLCIKQNIMGRTGYPDRLVIKPDGTYVWVELKTETGKLSAKQEHAIATLRKQKAIVYVAYGLAQALVIAATI